MVSEAMERLGTRKSTIRTIFEYGRHRAAVVGEENVFDFSIGNPSVPAPEAVKQAVMDIFAEYSPMEIHGYTVAPGNPAVRERVAGDLAARFGAKISRDNIFMTAGAAAAITICLKALSEPGDEFVALAPFFPEYRCFTESVGGTLTVVPAQASDFQIDFAALEASINRHTKAVIVNSPNNPSGAVYSLDTIKKLASLLTAKGREYGRPIFIISDEPYRDIVYDGYEVPYIPNYYDNTLVCYSYSKCYSLPGERIGYIAVSPAVEGFSHVWGAVCGAARVLTHVNAPSLWQLCVAKLAGLVPDMSAYKVNGELLYEGLTQAGFHCVRPQGAFYLFPQALEDDDYAFCERAKKYDLLLVPGTDFGCPGFFRAAYCVKKSTIERSLPLFKKLAAEYGVHQMKK